MRVGKQEEQGRRKGGERKEGEEEEEEGDRWDVMEPSSHSVIYNASRHAHVRLAAESINLA